MLELYHHGSSTCAAKVRFALAEKALPYEAHYVDILRGENFRPEYLKLNPQAVVPTLVHDGEVLVESTVICEYLDDAFPDRPLRPASARDRARMRLWTKAVDESLQPATKYVTYASCHRHILKRLPPDKFEQYMRGPEGEAAIRVAGDPAWVQSKRAIVELGIAAPGVAEKFRIYDLYLQKMDDALRARPWLAGATFSLADVSLAPYVNRLDMLGMSELWTRSRPRLADWFARVQARPTFKPCFRDVCPPDLAHDLATYGAQSWPEVRRILG
ncbi:MAG: glutathione S-transferase family protein [Burkholderiales bacterium]